MSAISDRIAGDFASAAAALGAGAETSARRRGALRALEASGLPSSRDENWKYANLRSLERVRFLPVPAGGTLPEGVPLPAPLAGIPRYLFVDGRFAPAASAPLGSAVRVQLSAQDETATGAQAPCGDARFALLNAAFARDVLSIDVPASAASRLQLEVLHVASADAQSGASYPRLEVRLAQGAELTLIERHLSAGEAASFVASAVEVQLGRGARLDHYRLQELNTRSTVFDTLSAQLLEESVYRLHAIGIGGQSARSTLALRLAGERSELALAVVSLGDARQVQDAYALVEHSTPNARTVQTFRGIAAGRARVAFNGKIIVATGAHGTDSQQSLRGLLAGAEAEIDLRPQLEIYTDDVRCSHGATAGKLDDAMLFYLLSRGLDRDAAQRLLKWAFLEDVISQIPLRPLRRQIEERLAIQLRDDALRELL